MTFQELKNQIGEIAAKKLGAGLDLGRFDVSLAADSRFGDYATNVAMVYAKELGRRPRELAEELAEAIRASSADIERVEVAGPGFINMWLTDQAVATAAVQASQWRPDDYVGKQVVTEFSDPNPFKVLHVGHLYTSVVGDAIGRLIARAGGIVHPVNFGGDVGLHVGKTLWAILQELGGEHPDKLEAIEASMRSEWMAGRYVAGTQAYEDDTAAKQAIMDLNRQVYRIHAEDDHDSALAQVYWTCRQWSYDYFDAFYDRLGVHFERYYPESQTSGLGLETVSRELAKGVYSTSDGAVVFEGEKYGLHTRVFITSQGLPTYEAKDVGLIMAKWRDYHFDQSVVITGNDITEYMKVVLKSLEQFEPELAARTRHITHGNVKLAGGIKMSSRKGNFLRAVDVLDMATEANRANGRPDDERVVLGAVKYSFLKQRIGADLVYVPEESMSLDGNSGPYLQYAHARARSIATKAGAAEDVEFMPASLDENERVLAFKIGQYAEVIDRAVEDLMPHHICTYLYELAQVFNRFYERSRVIGDPRQHERLRLVLSYADVLADGLALLGVDAPEKL